MVGKIWAEAVSDDQPLTVAAWNAACDAFRETVLRTTLSDYSKNDLIGGQEAKFNNFCVPQTTDAPESRIPETLAELRRSNEESLRGSKEYASRDEQLVLREAFNEMEAAAKKAMKASKGAGGPGVA
ncbi:MAG: hypothetical protein K2Q12_08560 [Rickettsiales bacterium]|nr:hypothetical protein [Rickettsiales bacterium]